MIENFNKEFVNGIKFQEISDYIWDINRRDLVPLTGDSPKIIFCKTDFLDDLFRTINDVCYPVTLITHCSDHDINEERFNKRPACVKKWFGQNVNYRHDDLFPLPIGIENHEGPNMGRGTDFNFMFSGVKPLPISNKIINKIYCNFNMQTHFNRINVARTLHSKGHFIDGKHSYKDYILRMQQFLFVASPRGNGIDCHRTWEALYYGCIPIVERHHMYDFYNLPIIQIDNWANIDENVLSNYIQLYKENKAFCNIDQLQASWWFDYIKNKTFGENNE